jgi:hypothetical protein
MPGNLNASKTLPYDVVVILSRLLLPSSPKKAEERKLILLFVGPIPLLRLPLILL